MFKLTNQNYCATIIEIKNLITLDNCDNVCATSIMGNQVIISNTTKTGDVGLFFPVETQLSKEYLSNNNLYRNKDLNVDKNKGGYFEENGRIRCVKFRGNKSEGLFMPIESLEFTMADDSTYTFSYEIGSEFNEFNSIEICKKYVPKFTKMPGKPGSRTKGKGKLAKESKLIDNQFRFHQDTSQLYRNLHKITPESLISITYKLHGTSGISSKILCKKKLKWYEKLAKKVGLNIVNFEYDYIYSSRKVIKNEDLNPNAQHYYNEDIWGIADKQLREYIQNGMTLYYEIVGYLPSGGAIQKDYDYGESPLNSQTFSIYIYRITYTNNDGKVFEFSAKQVQDWCHYKGLKAVPQLYYGYAKDLLLTYTRAELFDDFEKQSFLSTVKSKYNEKDCYICNNKVPEEGCVVRIEGEDFEAFKCKSAKFYEWETKQLDKGETDIETEN